jgi:uncharacterized protein YjbI with pentapeptide repeats
MEDKMNVKGYTIKPGANLQGANLRWTNLQGADLPNTDICLTTPWGWAHIQREHIRIGCEYHTVAEWEAFSDIHINHMDIDALEWWKQWKTVVMAAAKACKPYGE